MPAPGMDADMDRCSGFEILVGGELDLPQCKLRSADVQHVGVDLTRVFVHHRLKSKEFARDPHRLLASLAMNCGPACQLGEVATVGLFPQHRAVAQNLRWHIA